MDESAASGLTETHCRRHSRDHHVELSTVALLMVEEVDINVQLIVEFLDCSDEGIQTFVTETSGEP